MKSKTITSNECAFQYSVKRRIVKLKVVCRFIVLNVMTNMIKERESLDILCITQIVP